MMPVRASATRPMDWAFVPDRDIIAAVVCRTEQGNLHAGLLYRDRGGVVGALHVGWENHLYNAWDDTRICAAPPIEPERRTSAAALCRRIWRRFQRDGTFPYALRYTGSTFQPNGALQLSPDDHGLSCATFVLAVFQSVGVALIRIDEWPIRHEQDRAFITWLRHNVPPHHTHVVDRIHLEVEAGCHRVHPHEVVGACALLTVPGGFDDTAQAAATVLAKVDER